MAVISCRMASSRNRNEKSFGFAVGSRLWLMSFLLLGGATCVDASQGQDGSKSQEDGLVSIPGGCFLMGEEDTSERAPSSPRHEVCLRPFRIQTHLVTREDFTWMGDRKLLNTKCPKCPVQEANWEEANLYCQFQGLELPTEAQWERAARALDTSRQVWKDTAMARAAGWVAGRPRGLDSVVPGFRNPWGVQNLFVTAEWTRDWLAGYPKWKQTDPTGVPMGDKKVVRGKGFGFRDLPRHAWRTGLSPRGPNTLGVGFRCVEESH
jgi:formylglycine-generating enzyme required for sulfatase activity